MTKQLKKRRSKTELPVFPSGIEYDAIPDGARHAKVLWKTQSKFALLPDRRTIELPEEMIPCDLELAIETEANLRLVKILRSAKIPTEQDCERCATKPPMSGQRLAHLLQLLGHQSEQYAKKAVESQRRLHTKNARTKAVKNAVMRDGRDWRIDAREIENGNDPKTGKPWRTKEGAITYIMNRYNKSRSAVLRALDPPDK